MTSKAELEEQDSIYFEDHDSLENCLECEYPVSEDNNVGIELLKEGQGKNEEFSSNPYRVLSCPNEECIAKYYQDAARIF